MCGIAGIYRPAIKEDFESFDAVKGMVDLLKDRGPDNSAVTVEESAVIGHTRLAIMDPSNKAADQPLMGSRWTLAYNGEIYNFRELRRRLEGDGVQFKTDSDTEVLLELIELVGVDAAVEQINGIFAFAAYDREERKLFLVRDRLGVKPLYYWRDDVKGSFWFASTPAAIAKIAKERWKLNRDSLYSFFKLGAPMTRSTFFDGIERLRPAEKLVIDSTIGIRKEIYWKPAFREGDIEQKIIEAHIRQKEAHVPSAVFLSGGIDSSVTTHLLKDVAGFHLDSPEKDYADYVAHKVGVDLKIREYTQDVSFDHLLERYASSSGEASASSPIPLMVSELIAEEGFKVAFSANGADELFLGYPRTPTEELLVNNMPSVDYEAPSVESGEEQYYHIFRDNHCILIDGYDVNSQTLDDMCELSSLGEEFSASASKRWLELQTYVGYDLNPTLDFSSMACSLEVRVPFLDHELVELALSMDANEILSCDWGRKQPLKKILKKAGFNPALWSRPKVGFSIPANIMSQREQSIREHLNCLKLEGIFRMGHSRHNAERDYQYLGSAAHAFSIWKNVWMDSGKVVC